MHYQIRRALTASVLPMVCLTALAQKTVTGTVKDAKGEPLIGVTVFVDGKPGSITDIDGNFSIPNASPSSKVKVSYVGYKDQTVTLGNSSKVNIVLQEDNAQLDEVVVVGYGTMKKKDLTGSISSVNVGDMVGKGAPTMMESLQGTTPGVNITQSSSRTGGDFNIEIRGKSSIESDTKPMYVVDGVICDDIQFLNPQDIERIDVLKDASSTAIYGSRATAGVIMVTTKGGLDVKKDSKPTISYDGYYGLTKTARMPNFMSGEQFYRYRLSKFMTPVDNSANPTYQIVNQNDFGMAMIQQEANDYSSPFVLKEMLRNGETYNWPNLVTKDGEQQNHYIAVNGTGGRTSYHFGVGYSREKGIYSGDDQKKVNFKGSLDTKINDIVSAGFSVNLARIDNSYANDEAIKLAYRVNPFMRPYDKDGNINHYPGAKGTMGTDNWQFSDFINPLDIMKNTSHKRETWRMLGNLYLKFDIIKGLNFKTTFSPNYTNYRDGQFSGYINPETQKTYDDKDASTSTATVKNAKSLDWTWDNIINYNTTIAKDHSINFMGLVSWSSWSSENYSWVANGVLENTDWWNMNSGEFNKDDSGTGYIKHTMLSYALRANYSYKGKYLLTGTVRWDGSSKFDPDYRWGCFPSVAAAWRITEESFMKNAEWLSNLKLRVSYGLTGNSQGVGAFGTIQTVDSPTSYPFGSAYINGFIPGSIVDKKIQWEKSKEFNIGLDYGFLKNRINGTIDFYNKNSENLLYNVNLPLEVGGGRMRTNVGRVQNTGVELQLNTVNVQTKDWLWTTTFMFSHNKNKVKEINGVSDSYLNGSSQTGNLFVGKYINNVYTYIWDGIVTDGDMVVPNNDIAKAKNFTPGETVKQADYYYACYGLTEGQPIVRDKDGNGTIDDNDKYLFRSDPVWTGSLISNLSYKNWDFSFTIYTKQNYKVASEFMGSDYYDYHDRGRGKMYMDYYIPKGALIDADGMNADGTYINPVYQTETHYGKYPYPNYGTNDGIGKFKDQWDLAKKVVNGSYVKVKTITLGYTFPKKLLTPWGCQYLRLYATVTNPFVFTKYKGFDPEWADASLKNDGPSTVTYQIGASIKF